MPNRSLGSLACLALLVLTACAPTVTAALPAHGEREGWTWTLVDPRGLALGGGGLDEDDVRHLHEQGFRAVLNYRAEYPEEEAPIRALGMEYLLIAETYAEEDTMLLEDVERAVAFIEENLAKGNPVYVHCTGGWHRSAVGVVAYYMKTNQWRFQQAWAHVAGLRPGIEARYADALLDYEARLFGERKLTLDLWTDRWDVAVGETVDLTAYVTHDGRPVEGAEVRHVVENLDGEKVATTGADGRASFRFTAPRVDLMQYVHAVARKDGFVAGYDRNVYWVKTSKDAPPTDLVLGELPARVEPGALVTLPVEAREAGKPANVRVTLTSECGTHFRAYTGWDGRMDATFRAPGHAGEYKLLVHANRFPAEPVFRELRLVVGEGGAPACEAADEPRKDDAPPAGSDASAPPAKTLGVPGLSAPLAALLVALVALARLRARPARP